MELKKGSVPIPLNEAVDSEVNKKWTEFETSFRDASVHSLIGDQAYQSKSPDMSESLVSSPTNQPCPDPVNQTSVTSSGMVLPSVNNQILQTNQAEAQKEVS